MKWHQWLSQPTSVTNALVDLASSSAVDVSLKAAKRAASKHKVKLADFGQELNPAMSIVDNLRDNVDIARSCRDIAKQLIYGPKALNLAATSERSSKRPYHIARLTEHEMSTLQAIAKIAQQHQVLIVRRLHPHFTI